MKPYVIHPELQYRLDRLERSVARGGRIRPIAVHEVRHVLRRLFEELSESGAVSRDLHESFSLLARRAETVRGSDELREVIRDARQFGLAVASYSQTRAMEQRLHELEGRLQDTAKVAAEDGHPLEDAVVTLDSLDAKRVLFAIMPFAEEFSDVWQGGIKRAASGTGLTPIRIDMITKTSEITDDIVKAIRLAEVVVVDVTRNNPNVMFEFGFALALKKPHVVISQSTEYLTFDIKNLRSLIYQNSWQGIESLHKDLQSYIRGAGSTARRPRKRHRSKEATGGRPAPTSRS